MKKRKKKATAKSSQWLHRVDKRSTLSRWSRAFVGNSRI